MTKEYKLLILTIAFAASALFAGVAERDTEKVLPPADACCCSDLVSEADNTRELQKRLYALEFEIEMLTNELDHTLAEVEMDMDHEAVQRAGVRHEEAGKSAESS
jgi:uncharacterized protein YlxW (UPF0749 family)